MQAEKADPYRRAATVITSVALSSLVLLFVLAAPVGAQTDGTLPYTVQPGDSLWRLSVRYNTSIREIQRANSLARTTIYIDEILDVPHAGSVHVVSEGDTLYRISRWYGVSVRDIQWVNRHHSHLIYPGQRLAIPGGESDAVGAAQGNGVAAHSTGQQKPVGRISASEQDLIARLVHSESEGEPYEGKVAVAAVVLNRVRSDQFPGTATAVIYESGQFEPVINGTIYRPADASAHRAVGDALAGWDPSRGALYFFNPAKTGNAFMWSRPVIRVIDNHRFTH